MLTIIHRAAQLVGVTPSGMHCQRGSCMRAPGIVTDGALVIRDGIIAWVGPTAEMPAVARQEATWIDAAGKAVLPGESFLWRAKRKSLGVVPACPLHLCRAD